jgi:predicted metal-dependent phosphoesterase TrpH
LIKADLHIHSNYSGDSDISLDKLVERCRKLGLGAVAVSDHGTAEGGLRLAAMQPPFKVIVAEEVLTTEGEIMGLFLKETVPNGLTPEETIRRVHRQGGLVNVPHPFDRFRSSAVQAGTLDRIASQIDILECFNARTIPLQDLSLPRRFAKLHNIPMGAGSDSHSIIEVGRGYINMPDFTGSGDFVKAVAASQIHGDHPNLFIYAETLTRRITRRLRGKH